MAKQEKLAVYIPKEGEFKEFLDFYSQIDQTSPFNKTAFLRHMLLRGWKDYKSSSPVEGKHASLSEKPVEQPKEAPNAPKETPSKTPHLNRMDALGA